MKEAPLTGFGGLYTEGNPRSYPAGASPLCHDVDFEIGGVTIRPGLTLPLTMPAGSAGYQWLKSAALPGNLRYNLFNDTAGNLWYENLASPGTMTNLYAGILNNARAISSSMPQREFIALSDLTQGTDQPRQWDGTNLDRVSQVGPGSGPTVPPQAAPAIYNVSSIQQPYASQTIDSAVWGSAIDEFHAPPAANSLWILGAAGAGAAWLGDIAIGDYIYISSMGNLAGQNPNGTYQVAATGFFTDGTGTKPYIMVKTGVAVSDFARGTAGGTYQKTQAVLTISPAIPAETANIGGNITVSGTSPNQWNASWKIIATPTFGQLLIQSTSLLSNLATYTYSTASGESPGWQQSFRYVLASTITDQYGHVWQVTVPGTSGGGSAPFPSTPSGPVTDNAVTWVYQSGATVLVTVFGTSNGNGIFNVQNAAITSATATTFTVSIISQNLVTATEAGNAVSGAANVFIIDPGTVTLNTGSPGEDPIFGNASAVGIVVPPDTGTVASGQRYAVLMFLTRNNFITPASPPVAFFTTGQSTQVTFNNLAIGPPNVIARIVAITPANSGIGGPYYWIPSPVTVAGTAASLGQTTTYSATVVNDNVSTTTGALTFSDIVLTNGINITIDGNNLIRQREIGEFVKVVNYFGRAFYLGERVKVDNFTNLTFDGGVVNRLPAGWNVTASLSSDVSVVASPIVNTSLYIDNPPGPKIVQSSHNQATNVNSITVVLPAAPTPGNSLVIVLCGLDSGTLYPAHSGFTKQASVEAVSEQIAIYTRTVVLSDPATWIFSLGTVISGYTNIFAYEIPGTPSFTASQGSSGGGAVDHMATSGLSPTGTVMVFGVFGTNGYPANYLYPPPYALLWNVGSVPLGLGAVVAFATGNSIPSGPIIAYIPTWTLFAGAAYGTLICTYSSTSITINPTGTLLANMATLSQSAYQGPLATAIIETDTSYSLRVTASIPSGSTSGSLVIELYSPSLALNWPVTIPFSSMATSLQEFILPINNPMWQPVPSDLQLRVYPLNMLAGADVLVDRIEIFPTNQPVYATQLSVSYGENYEAVDAITGIIDTSNFTANPQTDMTVLGEILYIKTAGTKDNPGGRTFKVSGANQSGEPSTWTVLEVSNTVGECGPLSSDVGEEYSIEACPVGLYLFDGGNHSKISQEIYKIWAALYPPALNTVWVKNDTKNKRILVGVPLPTPNQWLPEAASNPTPTVPNVMLVCSYLGLDTGPEIAAGHAVSISMFGGNLIWKDGRRKWTIWQIPSPYSGFLPRADGSILFLIGGAVGTGDIYELTDGILNDEGAVIPQRYMTYGFSDKATQEQLQIGSARMTFGYLTARLEGSGNATMTFYSETPQAQYPTVQSGFALKTPATDDVNCPLNEEGNALFCDFETDGVLGSYFKLNRVVLQLARSTWLPVSGGG